MEAQLQKLLDQVRDALQNIALKVPILKLLTTSMPAWQYNWGDNHATANRACNPRRDR